MSYDRSIISVQLREPVKFADAECVQIADSLRRNGIVVIENFLDRVLVEEFAACATAIV
jgi:hypothetical protein